MIIREIKKNEYRRLGQLMIEVYSNLDGFPGPNDQPEYYEELKKIGTLNERKDAKVLVAISSSQVLLGGVAYFSDMAGYGSGGTATAEKNASGIRLLGVDPSSRGQGVGTALIRACIELAKEKNHAQVILHTTSAMQVAWKLYLKMGFRRSQDLDFEHRGLSIFGFRISLQNDPGRSG